MAKDHTSSWRKRRREKTGVGDPGKQAEGGGQKGNRERYCNVDVQGKKTRENAKVQGGRSDSC